MLHSESGFASKAKAVKCGLSLDSTTLDADAAHGRHGALARALRRHVPLAAVVTIAALLSGCAMSPGMSYSSRVSGTGTIQSDPYGTSGTARTNGKDAPPPNTLIEINSDLVAKETAARPKGIPQGVTKLFAKPTPYVLGPGDVLSIVIWDHPELNLPEAMAAGGQDA